MTTHYSVCVERCCPLESIWGFFWLQMWINYINVPLESVYVETTQDVSKYIHLFHRSSDLLTYLKFQYSKVIHVTISFIEVVLISFQYLLANASEEHFLMYGVCYDFYPLYFTFLNFFKIVVFKHLSEERRVGEDQRQSQPHVSSHGQQKSKRKPSLLFMTNQNKSPL